MRHIVAPLMRIMLMYSVLLDLFHMLIRLLKGFRTFVWSLVANLSHNSENKVRANGFTWLSATTYVGRNVNFNGFKVYGGGIVEIGNNFHSGKGVTLYTQSHNYSGDAIPYDKAHRLYRISIGDNVWLGDNVTIVGNVVIGEGAIVQVGSVVSANVSALQIVGGNPARPFRKRDSGHYFRVKDAGRFH